MQKFPFLDTQAINPGICEICKSLIRGRNVNSVQCICVVPNLYIYVDIFFHFKTRISIFKRRLQIPTYTSEMKFQISHTHF